MLTRPSAGVRISGVDAGAPADCILGLHFVAPRPRLRPMSKKCPLCGSSVVYQGLNNIECDGYTCPNRSKAKDTVPMRAVRSFPALTYCQHGLTVCAACGHNLLYAGLPAVRSFPADAACNAPGWCYCNLCVVARRFGGP